jgi:hypothetical protein
MRWIFLQIFSVVMESEHPSVSQALFGGAQSSSLLRMGENRLKASLNGARKLN